MKISPISESIYTIELSGRFDAHVAPDFAQKVDALKTSKQNYLIVNLANVSFIDSTALAALVRSMKHYRENHGELYIVELQNSVRIIFELTRMDRAFSIFPAAANALADIQANNK